MFISESIKNMANSIWSTSNTQNDNKKTQIWMNKILTLFASTREEQTKIENVFSENANPEEQYTLYHNDLRLNATGRSNFTAIDSNKGEVELNSYYLIAYIGTVREDMKSVLLNLRYSASLDPNGEYTTSILMDISKSSSISPLKENVITDTYIVPYHPDVGADSLVLKSDLMKYITNDLIPLLIKHEVISVDDYAEIVSTSNKLYNTIKMFLKSIDKDGSFITQGEVEYDRTK